MRRALFARVFNIERIPIEPNEKPNEKLKLQFRNFVDKSKNCRPFELELRLLIFRPGVQSSAPYSEFYINTSLRDLFQFNRPHHVRYMLHGLCPFISQADPYMNASHASDILPSRSPTDPASLIRLRVIQSGSLARNTHRPFRQIAYPRCRKRCEYPLYKRQKLRILGGMRMASGRSLPTTRDRVNTVFCQ